MAATAQKQVSIDKLAKSPSVQKRSIGFGNAILDNMTNAELTMIHRLSGNDPQVRKVTMRKLRKWLKAIATKVSDTLDTQEREHLDGNFARVWKALFYCTWMADKQLPQETLTEQISNLLSIFSHNPNLMMLFVQWFFTTFAREWPWIDRLRLDKFMMLIRRFLRKLLLEFSKHDWNVELLDQFDRIIAINLFNHHPPLSKKAAKKTPQPPKAPMGFQMHIINIFLEELAKIGGSSLESDNILRLLTPFIDEMAQNDDDRLLEEIKTRIFHHLMKQSDVGIDYVESRGGTMELVELDDEEMNESDENELSNEPTKNGPLDPRAGQVDVVLPQLNIDYEALIEKLTASATQKNTRAKNRKILMSLVREFQKLTKGQFPLGFKHESRRTRAIKRSAVEEAAKRLVEMEEKLKEEKPRRGDKKRRRKEKKLNLFQATGKSDDAVEGYDDNDSDAA